MATTKHPTPEDETVPEPGAGDHPTRAERQRAVHEIGDPPRRLMPAGRVWLIGLVCFLVGALLNAPGIRKTALGQDVGWQRDVATFFADPLYDLSHSLLLDRPRDGLQEVIGRSGQDDVDFSLPSPTTVPGTPTTPTTAPKKRAFTPTNQMRLWVGGDSLAITPGESVINQALGTNVIGITDAVDGHVATGLARPEVFNWPAYLQEVIATHDPDSVVLTIGSNDDQALTGDGGGQSFGYPDWQDEYRRRVGGLMDQVTGSGDRTLFWVGIPLVRNGARIEGYTLINDIVKSEAAKRPGKVVFVDTVPVLAGPDGAYADYLTNADGTVVQVRAGDGIHFTREGGDRIAAAVLAAMQKTFDLTSWQTATTTTTAPPATATSKPTSKPKAKATADDTARK
jgi:hypothetical protein